MDCNIEEKEDLNEHKYLELTGSVLVLFEAEVMSGLQNIIGIG